MKKPGNRILILFAHPALHKSRVNRHLIRAADGLEDVTVHDLYEHYPKFHIDVPREQDLLRSHDVLLLQHPFYWYSSPALLKEWFDLVLQYGFAFGSHGRELEGKGFLQAITMGGGAESYGPAGGNKFTVRQFLAPFEQTAGLCHMRYLAPFVVQGTHAHSEEADVRPHVDSYRKLLLGLHDGTLSFEELEKHELANELLET